MAKYTDKQAQDELKRLIDEIDNVRKKPRLSPKFKAWQAEASELLERLFGRSSKQVKEFDRIPYSLAAFSNQTPDSKFDEAFHQGLKTAAIALSSAVKEVQTNGVGGKSKQSSVAVPSPKETVSETKTNSVPPPVAASAKVSTVNQGESKPGSTRRVLSSSDSNKVLVISSKATNVSSEITEFLSKIGLTSVTVDNAINQHDSLFSIVEENSDTGYAVVLLGFDSADNSNDHAFGLGALVGRLGKDRVCAVLNDKMTGIDTYKGVTYVPVDAAGAWKFMMIRNLKAAGFDVDANLAL